MHYRHWIKRKRRSRPSSRHELGRLARALRAELLEGRMMLSVASPAMVPTWPSFELEGDVGQQVAFSSLKGTVDVLKPSEGGFLFSTSMNMDRDTTSIQAWRYASDATIDELLSQESTLFGNDTTVVWSNYDAFESGGFVGRVISSGNFAPDLSPASHPELNDDAAAVVQQEGGLISVNPISTPVRLASEPKAAESALTKSLSTLGAKPSSLVNSSSESLPVREISGEWARAVMFEIAGGEPAGELRQSEGPPVDAIASDESDAETTDHSNKDSGEKVVDVPLISNDDAVPMPVEQESVRAHDSASTSIEFDMHVLARRGDLLTSLQDATSPNEIVSLIRASIEDRSEAIAVAFEKFGDGELAVSTQSNDRLRLNSWLSGTPLLLMFALERMTARNSRRRQASEENINSVRPRLS